MRIGVRPVLHQETLVMRVFSELLCGSHFTASHDLFKLLLTNSLNFLLFLHRVPLVERMRVCHPRVLPVVDLLLSTLLVGQLVG